MVKPKASDSLPSYKNPPLGEVACGCQIEPLDRMKLPHYGNFWERLRGEYPLIEHASPIVAAGKGFPPVDATTGLPLPRIFFLDKTESQLVQLQTDRIHFNWRRKDAAPVYPHYPDVIRRFTDSYETLGKFAVDMGLGPIQPTVLELTYTNYLIQGECWNSFEDLGQIFKDFNWKPNSNKFLAVPTGVAWQATYSLPSNNGQLTVKVVQGKRSTDNANLYTFELTAQGIGADKTLVGMRAWFDLAHEWIVKGFTDLTLPDIQYKVWGREK